MAEEHGGEELIKCSCCKCFYEERFYDLNRLGNRYKTCKKCRSKRITYQENRKKKNIYEKNKYNTIENIEKNEQNTIENIEKNKPNTIENSNDNMSTLCKKCNEYVCKEETEYNEITGNTICTLCIMNYHEYKLANNRLTL